MHNGPLIHTKALNIVKTHLRTERETSHEYWTSFEGSNWMRTSLCTVCHCWIIDPPRCRLRLSEWTVVLLCTSPRGNSLSMAIAKQLNRHWRNIAACLICRGVNVLSRFLGFAFNAEQEISSFFDVMSLFAGMRSSMTRTTMCWGWRRLPLTMRAHLPVWRKTEWENWRPRPLSQSEVQNTFLLCFFTLTGTKQHLEKSLTTEVVVLVHQCEV